jgi:hypothetical protein
VAGNVRGAPHHPARYSPGTHHATGAALSFIGRPRFFFLRLTCGRLPLTSGQRSGPPNLPRSKASIDDAATCLPSKWPTETHHEPLAESVVAMQVCFRTGSAGFESLKASQRP